MKTNYKSPLSKLLTNITLSFTLSLILLLTLTSSALASLSPNKTFPDQTNVPLNKVWKIKFNQPVDVLSIDNIKLYNSNGSTFNIQPEIDPNDSKIVLVKHTNPFEYDKTYHLFVYSGVKSKSGENLPCFSELTFTTVSKVLTIDEVEELILGKWISTNGKTSFEFFSDGSLEEIYGNTMKYESTYSFSSITRIKIQNIRYYMYYFNEWHNSDSISTHNIKITENELRFLNWNEYGDLVLKRG